jgi:hypothetical protein
MAALILSWLHKTSDLRTAIEHATTSTQVHPFPAPLHLNS